MTFQIGTDEAGYGPNLGPLTVTGTLWQTKDGDCELYRLLSDAVWKSPSRSGPRRLFIADSKQVYGASKKLESLELPVLAIFYAHFDRIPNCWLELTELICGARSVAKIPEQSWLFGRDLELPIAANPGEIRELGDLFSQTCQTSGVRLSQIQCEAIFPPQFNHEIARLGNKASFLSTVTLEIVRNLLNATNNDTDIVCDKHGGRSRYAGLIQEILTDEFVFVGTESLAGSEYQFCENDRDIRIRFQARGESFLPTALASMISKYVREVFMVLWNDFWQIEIPNLKPTKGYPQDAKRFKAAIAAKQTELGISDHSIWRNK